MKKILFSIRNKEIFSYHESVIENLSNNGYKVHLVFSENSNNDFFSIDPNPLERIIKLENVSHEFLKPKRNILQKLNFIIREIINYLNYYEKPYKKFNQHPFYQKRWEKTLPIFVRFIFTKLSIGKLRLVRKAFKLLASIFESISGYPENHVKIINSFSPDMIIGTPCNLRFSEEIDFIKYGKNKNIYTIISVLSWDNLTTKGGFAVKPDMFFAWNETHRNELIKFHKVNENTISVCGSPFFDKWFNEKYQSFDINEFENIMNIKSNQEYLLYLGSSKNLGKFDENIIDELLNSIKVNNNKSINELILLIKPHSTHKNFLEKYSNHPNARIWNSNFKWIKDQSLFKYAFENAKCSIGLNTTGMIDSVINNCPVISITHTKLKNEPTHSAIHFKNIIESEIYYLVNELDNFEKIFNNLKSNQNKFNKNREAFISKFVRPNGIKLNVGDITRKNIEINLNK